MHSEKVETESVTLSIKEVDSEKTKVGLRTCPEKVVDSGEGERTLAGAEAVGLRRIVVDLARVRLGTAKAGMRTCPEILEYFEKVKAGLGRLTGAEAVGLRRIVVDLARVGPGTAKTGSGDTWMWKPRKRRSHSCG